MYCTYIRTFFDMKVKSKTRHLFPYLFTLVYQPFNGCFCDFVRLSACCCRSETHTEDQPQARRHKASIVRPAAAVVVAPRRERELTVFAASSHAPTTSFVLTVKSVANTCE